MNGECRESVLRVWLALFTARRRVLAAVAADLKAAGLPSLGICHVLIHLAKTANMRLRPVELEERLELPQYTLSRLIDRMAKSRLVRREACPEDGRSHFVAVTEEGLAAMQAIWPVYCAAVERHVGANLCDASAGSLASLLDRIAASSPIPETSASISPGSRLY
jgi:DNA-binding MarR family transcriptional regulator